MKKKNLILTIGCLIFFFSSIASAVEDYYPFSVAKKQQRFDKLTSELRCLVCQNQTLAESNAPLAFDLRDQIYQKIQENQSDREIIDYLVSRYGHFILYTPPFSGSTLGLWCCPFFFLIIAMSYLFFYIFKKNRIEL